MEVIGSLTSPFTRIVRVMCEYLCVDYDFKITPPFGKLTNEDNNNLAIINPLMKVPVLKDGENTILDSRIIANYLIEKYAAKNNYVRTTTSADELNVVTVIYGVIDAGILIFMLRASYAEISTTSGYIAKAFDRVRHGLIWLDKQKLDYENIALLEIALICGLDWFTKRKVIDWSAHSNLKAIYAKHRNSEPFSKTVIPTDI